MRHITLIIVLIGVFMILGYFYLRHVLQSKDVQPVYPETTSPVDLRPLFIAKLKQLVKDGSDGLYQLSIDSMQVDVLQSKITLSNITFTPDSAVLSHRKQLENAPADVFKFSLHTLHIDGIGIKDVLSKKTIDLDTIYLQQPVIEVYRQKTAKKNKAADSLTLYQKLFEQMKSISVQYIHVQQGKVIHHNIPKGTTSTFNDVEVQLAQVLIDSATQYDSSRFLFAKDALISLHHYKTRTSDGLYDVKLGSVQIAAVKRRLDIHQFTLSPRLSKHQFSKKLPRMKERYNVTVSNIQLRNVDWWSLANEESLEASVAEISDASVQVYLDRSMPPPTSKMGNYPQQLLQKIKMPVHIATLLAHNIDVLYEEYNPTSGKTGQLHINNINAKATNITNKPEQIRKNKQSVLTANAKFLRRIPMNVTLRFDLARARQGNFSANVHMDGFDGKALNVLSEPLGLVTVKSGEIKEIKADIIGNNNQGTGHVLLLYDDLHITALKKDEDKENGLKKKRIMSFIANTFVIKDANPKGEEEPRKPDAFYKRDPEGSFFNLVWKTMLVGILKTVGAPEKLAKKKGK